MPYVNRKCNYCGKEYYVCKPCERKGSWKVLCCSRDCFRKLAATNTVMTPIIINDGKNIVAVGHLENGNSVNIIGFDSELNKFDCEDGITREKSDFTAIEYL